MKTLKITKSTMEKRVSRFAELKPLPIQIDKIIFNVNAGTAITPTYLIIALAFSPLNIDFFADI